MQVYVPFDARQPKRRLAPVLSEEERRSFAEAMLRDVLAALDAADLEPTVLSTGSVSVDAPVETDDRELTPAVNDRLGVAAGTVAVVMADLPLLTPGAVDRLLATGGDVVLAPGLGGGTNALIARTSGFRVDYHGGSIRDHRDLAAELDLEVGVIDSYRLGIDVDEPDDLVEVLLHGVGRGRKWLVEHDVRLRTDRSGRVTIERGPVD